jgi:hypothetical protein
MSEENKDLKEKIRRLEQICKNITETSKIASGNIANKDLSLAQIAQNELEVTKIVHNEFEDWQLNSPVSTKN